MLMDSSRITRGKNDIEVRVGLRARVVVEEVAEIDVTGEEERKDVCM